jgi:hypothetical protein
MRQPASSRRKIDAVSLPSALLPSLSSRCATS